MKTLLEIVIFISSISLIFSVLLNPANSTGMGGIGSPSEMFGSQKGAESGLNKVTAVLALIIAILAVVLSTPSMLNQ